jgi:molybdenum cofactor biosynthesis enzyme MoaA
MNPKSLIQKFTRGLPYLGKELRAIISNCTPCFIAFPRTIHIWRDAPCNGKCIMCINAYRSIFPSLFTDEMMTRALNEIHELCGRGTLVSYNGGEPLICRHIIEWIEQAGELKLDFRFTTNGYLMTKDLARRFVAAGLFNIGVSLESLNPKVNETIRPYQNGTEKTLRCIELLMRRGSVRGSPSVSILRQC